MKIDWRLVVAIVALIVAILSFFGGSWWRTSDIVFDKRAVEIPLSDSLRTYIEHALAAAPSDSIAIKKNGQEVASSRPPIKTLPDKLLYVNIRNVGHVPSATVKVRIALPGQIAGKSISDAGSAYGMVGNLNQSYSTGELSFECQNLSNHPDARIKVALWYQANHPGTPIVDIQDTAAGMSREVGSVDTARFYWWDYITPIRVGAFVLIGLFMLSLGIFYVTRSGGDLARRAEENAQRAAELRRVINPPSSAKK
jgi:hypothetical protein